MQEGEVSTTTATSSVIRVERPRPAGTAAWYPFHPVASIHWAASIHIMWNKDPAMQEEEIQQRSSNATKIRGPPRACETTCEHSDSETPMIDNRNSMETVLVFTMLCITYLSYTIVSLHRAVERPTDTCGILLAVASSDLLIWNSSRTCMSECLFGNLFMRRCRCTVTCSR